MINRVEGSDVQDILNIWICNKISVIDVKCDKCKEWGRTITREENNCAIPCDQCGRLTWPNLGVNCPAGMAWAFSANNAIMMLQAMQIAKDY